MHLSELKTFLAIIETGSLVQASQHLNVTQSTVTARLKSLEAKIGQTLLNRQKSGVTLTAAGLRLERYASTISDLWNQARQETALPDGLNSVCNFGCEPQLWEGLGEQVFEYVRVTIPQAALSVSMGTGAELSRWLEDGLIDFSLSYSSISNRQQDVIPIYKDQLILVSTVKNGPTRSDPNYIYVDAGEEFGRQHAAEYSDAGTARISFNTAQLGLEHLLQHGGSAYLPERIALLHLKSGELHVLEDGPIFERQSYLAVNQIARDAWPWFDDCLASISQG